MATIRKVPRKKTKSGFAYQVMIRRKGYDAVSETFEKLADARRFAEEHDREAKLSEAYGPGYTKTVAQMLDKYMETYSGKDQSKLDRLAWWREQIGDRKLRDLTPSLIVECLNALRRGHAVRGHGKGNTRSLGRRRSEPTVNRFHTALGSVLEVARKRWHWISENPARKVARAEENPGIVRWLSDAERKALLEACRESAWPGLYLLVTLALSTGARLGELWRLRWSDIDLDRGIAYLSDTKNKERRALALVPAVQAELRQWAKVRRLGSDLLCPATHNPKVPYGESFREHWIAAREKAGIENFRFHDLRHSCASYLALSGATPLEIADVLGHKTLQMVKRYSHLSTDHKQTLVNRVLGDKV
jgi:integrase